MNSIVDHKKEFIRTIQLLAGKYHAWEVFRDFVEMAAIAISNAMYYKQEREDRYLAVAKRYNAEELNQISRLLAIVTDALEKEPQDFLGSVFEELSFSSHWHGQFFTPYSMSKLGAHLLGICEKVESADRYISLNEPTCGAGGQIVAVFDMLRKRGINAQRKLYVVAKDLDATAAYMAYIQMSLMDIPGEVIIGDTLEQTVNDRFLTPAYLLYGWNYRLKLPDFEEIAPSYSAQLESNGIQPNDESKQMELF